MVPNKVTVNTICFFGSASKTSFCPHRNENSAYTPLASLLDGLLQLVPDLTKERMQCSAVSDMKFPAIFVNHGGGPMPLLGKQPDIVQHMKDVRSKWLPNDANPSAIVVFSAHWESDPIKITSAPNPPMLYDYYGFPPETYQYQYNAPGSPALAERIHGLLDAADIPNELDPDRGFDHGVFIPLMLMYPEATIPVVAVSLHSSLSAATHIAIGQALAPLRDTDSVLLLGSGYTFHNMQAFFHPSDTTYKASKAFNAWLKETLLSNNNNNNTNKETTPVMEALAKWESAPGARICHPREEHLLPLLMTAAAGSSSGSDAKATLIFETTAGNGNHAISSYRFD
jgi:4,5-DOPA dioxygenase extradiol